MTHLIPGELITEIGDIDLNSGREVTFVTVANQGDRPIQVGSHFHFYEANPALDFDRDAALGKRLDIPAGTANILQIETQIKKKAKEIYKTLVSKNSKKINLVKINDRYFFLMAGVGFDSKIVQSIDTKIKKYLGKISLVLEIIKLMLT